MEDSQRILDWLADKVFTFIVVWLFGYLGYFTQTRTNLISQHGYYWAGITDCALAGLTILFAILVVYSKIRTQNKKNQT